ncbi:SDR family oxidoreductase [Mycobacterium sp. E1747]|uniref:SDR family oxidoreductase n=1 Tax=Mycobacterium sp. E1747 TaxID=1834128 RepID=UPI0008011EAA|nr:SDR family oxidoreductase [Mycobacterium sp. E1747]OBH13580.1 short-chain dehydrogenase/reductase [Mycobacterium sp. E1747]
MGQRSWFITGVNSGFGRHLSELLLARGERVAGTVRRAGSVRDLQDRYGDRFWVAHLEVTDSVAVRDVVNRAFSDLGRIDVVINNAGYGLFGAVEELTDEQIAHQLNTNLVGSIQVVKAALPHLRAQGGGRILQLSSYGGQASNPGASLYHASKWGIEGFMESTAKDVAPFGVGITIVEPGGARTEFRTSSSRLGANQLPAYDISPATLTRGIKDPALPPPTGDPVKMANAMIDSVDVDPPPLRLVLGSDAYGAIRQALTERLAAVEAQRDLAATVGIA